MLGYLLQLWPESLTTQALIVGVVVGFSAYLLLKKRYKMPPGPRGWPLIGNMLDFKKDHMFRILHEWSKIYGPVFTISMGPMKMVILNRIDVVVEAMVKRGTDFAGRPKQYSAYTATEGGQDITMASCGPRWKLHRKLAAKAIRRYLTGEHFNKRLSKSVSITTDLMIKQKGPFDPYPYITLTVFNILSGMCFGKFSPDLDGEQFKLHTEAITEFFKLATSGMMEDIFPPLRLFPTPKFRRYMKVFNTLKTAMMKEIKEHKETFDPEHTRDLVDDILHAQMEAVSEEDPEILAQITDLHVMMTTGDIFVAGLDTTRNTIHWLLLVMALNPDIQKKVQEEVDSVIGPNLNISLSDRERLHYTGAVVNETMRVRNVGNIGLPHETMCDTEVGGYTLPKGTVVVINHYSLHHDPDQWEDVYEFKPERFLDASGKMVPKPDSFLPFSAGRRVCLGEPLAKPEIHLILAGIMRACSISLAPGTTHDFEPDLKQGILSGLPGTYSIVVESRI